MQCLNPFIYILIQSQVTEDALVAGRNQLIAASRAEIRLTWSVHKPLSVAFLYNNRKTALSRRITNRLRVLRPPSLGSRKQIYILADKAGVYRSRRVTGGNGYSERSDRQQKHKRQLGEQPPQGETNGNTHGSSSKEQALHVRKSSSRRQERYASTCGAAGRTQSLRKATDCSILISKDLRQRMLTQVNFSSRLTM